MCALRYLKCNDKHWPHEHKTRSSGAVWESRWTSWAVRPNEPSGFRGRTDLLNRASALVTTCPEYVNWHLRTLSNTTYQTAALSRTVSVYVKHHVHLLPYRRVPFSPVSLQRQVVCLLLRPVFMCSSQGRACTVSWHCFLVGVIKSYVIATSDLWLFIHASNLLPSLPTPLPYTRITGEGLVEWEERKRDTYAEEKKWVFSFDLKEKSEDECLTDEVQFITIA